MNNYESIIMSSIPLHLLNEKDDVVGIGSGCIIDTPNFDYLFTVYHVANNEKRKVVILKEFDAKIGKPIYLMLGQFTNQCIIKNNKIENIEFSYKKIPIKYDYYYQEIKPPNIIEKSLLKTKYKLQQIKTPNKNDTYYFAGHTQPSIIESYAIETKFMLHCDYKYIGTNDWMHIFEPPEKHQGDEYYSGCSGAPIIDENNYIVSLLVSGDVSRNEVYGINLDKALMGFKLEENIKFAI